MKRTPLDDSVLTRTHYSFDKRDYIQQRLELRLCALGSCLRTFQPTTTHRKFCSRECQIKANSERQTAKRRARRARWE